MKIGESPPRLDPQIPVTEEVGIRRKRDVVIVGEAMFASPQTAHHARDVGLTESRATPNCSRWAMTESRVAPSHTRMRFSHV